MTFTSQLSIRTVLTEISSGLRALRELTSALADSQPLTTALSRKPGQRSSFGPTMYCRVIDLENGGYAVVHGEPSDDPKTHKAINAVIQAANSYLTLTTSLSRECRGPQEGTPHAQ